MPVFPQIGREALISNSVAEKVVAKRFEEGAEDQKDMLVGFTCRDGVLSPSSC